MGLDDRIGWMLLGGLVGFGFGYLIRFLQEIRDRLTEVKEELDEVDEIVKRNHPDDAGFMNNRVVADVAMVIVLIIVAWSAFASQKASNNSSEASQDVAQAAECTEKYLSETITALNDRTTYVQAQAESNVQLQKAQAEFLSFILARPPNPPAERDESAQKYLSALTEFVEVSQKNVSTIKANPYPSNTAFQDCLEDKTGGKQ